MPTYVARWSDAKTPYETPKRFEEDEFFVENDPDEKAEWIIWYRFHNNGGHTDYWVKTDPDAPRSEVFARPSECTAVDVHVERLHFYHKGEARLSQLSRLALQLERSRAMLFNRPVRRFEGLGVRISTEKTIPLSIPEKVADVVEEAAADQAIEAFVADLVQNQEPLGDEFQNVLCANLFELYVVDPKVERIEAEEFFTAEKPESPFTNFSTAGSNVAPLVILAGVAVVVTLYMLMILFS